MFLMKRPVGAHSVTEYKDVFLWFQTEAAHAQDKVDGDKGLCLSSYLQMRLNMKGGAPHEI